MTSLDIKRHLATIGATPEALPLWEIAYQLAKQNEQLAEHLSLLDRAEPGKRDAQGERGTHFQHYYSTACQHGDHKRCRLLCKFCDKPCLCDCHQPRSLPSDPATEATSQPKNNKHLAATEPTERDASGERCDSDLCATGHHTFCNPFFNRCTCSCHSKEEKTAP